MSESSSSTSFIGSASSASSKHCDFTFALSDLEQCSDIIDCLPDFPFWAYIHHDPDDDNGSEHFHFYIRSNPMSLKAISEKLDLPINMIQWVRIKTKMFQYFCHLNHPNKKQYSIDEIKTNNRELVAQYIHPQDVSVDLHSEYRDFSAVSKGLISIDEYIDRHSNSLSTLSFYTRSIFLMRLINLKDGGFDDKKRF